MQAKLHALDAQLAVENGGAVQGVLQPPQFNGSAVVGVSQPSLTTPLQFAKPELQLAMVQAPDEHAGVPLGAVHTLPHAPQLATEVSRFASQPSLATWLQSWNDPLHRNAHVPLLHVGVEFGLAGQLVAQLPQ
jgi:hypothetical protein